MTNGFAKLTARQRAEAEWHMAEAETQERLPDNYLKNFGMTRRGEYAEPQERLPDNYLKNFGMTRRGE